MQSLAQKLLTMVSIGFAMLFTRWAATAQQTVQATRPLTPIADTLSKAPLFRMGSPSIEVQLPDGTRVKQGILGAGGGKMRDLNLEFHDPSSPDPVLRRGILTDIDGKEVVPGQIPVDTLVPDIQFSIDGRTVDSGFRVLEEWWDNEVRGLIILVQAKGVYWPAMPAAAAAFKEGHDITLEQSKPVWPDFGFLAGAHPAKAAQIVGGTQAFDALFVDATGDDPVLHRPRRLAMLVCFYISGNVRLEMNLIPIGSAMGARITIAQGQ